MKKILVLLFVVAFCGVSFAEQTAESIISDSVSMINEVLSQKDAADMAKTLRTSHAVALVPTMLKAGFVVGGEYGEGLILKHENGKWYGPSFYNIGGGSFGFQIGAEKISLLLAVINEKGVNAFLSSKTKLGGDIAIAAGPLGRRAEAATDAQAKASIYSYSMSKGLFAGVSLEGSVISRSVKRNKEYWGENVSAADALTKPADDERVQPLIKVLNELMKR
ncbi:MAG: lipid-binding SYLF domain-containing protein [Synergistaceae bacterium]|nr:lipid-binding SYLF domain-containing protein [Synergistaceae bacterium]